MLEITELSVSYGNGNNKKKVLDGVSFSPECGKITAVVGRNGCGKSTLLSCINGMCSYSGKITLDGKDIRTFDAREKAKRIAFLPQILPKTAVTVSELVMLGRNPYLDFMRKPQKSDYEICRTAVELTGIPDLADKPVNKLSGGEKQRAFLAMILAQDTGIIMLDEPTTYMDIGSRAEFFRLIRSLDGRTVLAVIHDLTEALRYCDMIAVLDEGKICFYGTCSECAESGILERTFGVRAHIFSEDGTVYTVFD